MKTTLRYPGLSPQEVIESRTSNGSNVVTPRRDNSVWKLFVSKFADPIIRLLLVLLVVSVGIAVYEAVRGLTGWHALLEPAGIFVAIGLSIGVGFVFELRAKREFDLLNTVNDDAEVKVARSGIITSIPRRDVVVGDIIFLESGEEVPADGLLLESVSLMVDESSLTGEPMTDKSHKPEDAHPDATYPSDQLLRGTIVLEGHGTIRVTAVGDHTDYGRVFEASHIDTGIRTPLGMQLEQLSHGITRISYIIALVVLVARVLVYFLKMDAFVPIHFTHYLVQSLLLALIVVVVAVPEGLPMSVTLSLAMSMRRMFRSGSLVRKMHATETMGATTIICTDKTGTLTENKMQVADCIIDPSIEGREQLIAESIAVNTTAHLDLSDPTHPVALGNPTEGALLLFLQSRYGQDERPYYLPVRQMADIALQRPFNNVDKYMYTVVHSPIFDGKPILYIKGAPEIIRSMCSGINSTSQCQEIETALQRYQGAAMRTLAVAYRPVERAELADPANLSLASSPLKWLGLFAIEDPVRCDVPEAVKTCKRAGMQIKMVTGDTPGTAKEIAKRVGIWDENAADSQLIEGATFAASSDEDLLDRIGSITVMSRAKPLDKARLVRLLVEKDEIVAVTGDGSNDAPAMNAAHIGLSMGNGTSVAKEAGDITILDNSFSTISKSVMWGRSVYLNIRRFILFQLTINVAACIIVLLGALIGSDSPLTVTQMLWVNLIMDTFAAMALASLPPSVRVMDEPPRRADAFIINRAMAVRIIGYGFAFVCVLFCFFQYLRQYELQSLADFSFADLAGSAFDFSSPSNTLSPYELSLFFTFFVMLQFWNIFNARAFLSHHSTFYKLHRSKGFVLIALCILVGQILITTFGGEMFGVRPLSVADWLIITIATSIVLAFGEVFRAIQRLQKREGVHK